MACYHAIPARQDGQSVKLWPPLGDANIALPCGKCLGCKTDRATQWANRCTHESTLHEHNCSITLTYDDDHIPLQGALRPSDLQRFIKRLRKNSRANETALISARTHNIRYFACGEYGGQNHRPHYHALLFNADFADKTRVGTAKGGDPTYTSEQLHRLWPYGHHQIGSCNARSAAYIAQYTLNKQPKEHYIDADGVFTEPPFLRMSLKPAIGAEWLKQYATDLQHGYLVENGRKHAIPRYYRDKIKEHLPELRDYIEQRIQQHRLTNIGDKKHPDRLQDQETIHRRRKELTESRQP